MLPKRNPDDQLYNRRLLTYIGLLYSAFWFLLVLGVTVVSVVVGNLIGAATVTALLSVPTTLAGLGFWRYLEACKHEDLTLPKKDAGHPEQKKSADESAL